MNSEEDYTEQVYQFIKEYIKEKGVAPAYREVAEGTFLSMGNVQRRISILIAQGRLRQIPRTARSLSLVSERQEADDMSE